jgi:hypothetical protein
VAGVGDRYARVALERGHEALRLEVVAHAHVHAGYAERSRHDGRDHREGLVQDEVRREPAHLLDQVLGVEAGPAHVAAGDRTRVRVRALDRALREEIDEARARGLHLRAEAPVGEDGRAQARRDQPLDHRSQQPEVPERGHAEARDAKPPGRGLRALRHDPSPHR